MSKSGTGSWVGPNENRLSVGVVGVTQSGPLRRRKISLRNLLWTKRDLRCWNEASKQFNKANQGLWLEMCMGVLGKLKTC